MSKIKHEQARVAFEKYSWLSGKLANWVGRDWSELEEEYNSLTNEDIDIIESYINQQEKQEKLLELYKELANLRDEMLDTCEIVDDDYYVFSCFRKKETNLEKQIKELEKKNYLTKS